MDSRLMYNATKYLTPMVTWDQDWIHFGTNNETKFDLVEKAIDEHLKNNQLFFISGRTNSGQYDRKEIINIIRPILGKENFQLWTLQMDKVIEFNKIGVLHLGIKN